MTDLADINPEFLITNEDQLRALFPQTHAIALQKSLNHIDKHAAAFLARAPFLCIGTQTQAGMADVSPRGDPPGFVKILDRNTLLIPDRPGNNRLDTQSNILANPAVGLLFMVPGFDETLRINGTAQITRDPRLLDLLIVQNRRPTTAVVVRVSEVFIHCAKAFRRAKLWDPAARQDRDQMPSLMKIILDQTTGAPQDPKDMQRIDEGLEDEYRASMY